MEGISFCENVCPSAAPSVKISLPGIIVNAGVPMDNSRKPSIGIGKEVSNVMLFSTGLLHYAKPAFTATFLLPHFLFYFDAISCLSRQQRER